MLIVVVVVGHLDFAKVARDSDRALSAAAEQLMGRAGYVIIAVAALLASRAAINVTLYCTGRLAYFASRCKGRS